MKIDTDKETPNRLPGEEGIWFFVLGDLVIFGMLFGSFVIYQAETPQRFIEAKQQLNPILGTANTLALLTSSWLMALSVQSLKQGSFRLTQKYLTGTIGLGLCFCAGKLIEYVEKAQQGLGVTTNDFFMFYFMMTGIHFVHVLVGLVLLMITRLRLRKDAEPLSLQTLENTATYWHLVDLLWVIMFPLLYLLK